MASWKLGKNQVMNITVCFKLSMWGFFCFLNKLAETYKIQDHSKKKKKSPRNVINSLEVTKK